MNRRQVIGSLMALVGVTAVGAPLFIPSERLDFGVPTTRLVVPEPGDLLRISGGHVQQFVPYSNGAWALFGSTLSLPEEALANEKLPRHRGIIDPTIDSSRVEGLTAQEEFREYFRQRPDLMTGLAMPSRWSEEDRLAAKPIVWRDLWDSVVIG